MVAYTYSKLPTANFNTTPPSIARSATGSVYDVGDTGFTTPLNITMVIGGAVVTTISSDALGFLPDFRLDGRVNCVWKQTGSSFATTLTTSDPIPGPASTVPGPPGAPGVADDASMAALANSPTSAFSTALSATYATRASAPFTINSTDSDGNPTSITYHVAGGDVTTTYTYGVNGVATETTAGQTITYTYDGSGNLTGAV